MTTAACTIVSLNYMAFARTLMESLLAHHPDWRFYVLIVDRLPAGEQLSDQTFEIVMVEDLGIPDFPKIAFKYQVLELNTNVKPTFLKVLLARGHDSVLYFDPDIQLHSRLTPVLNALVDNAIVVTPHSTSPISNDIGQEVQFLATGTYNLGFIAVKNSPDSLAMLNWWENRCLTLAFSELGSGLFVDQKWINLSVCYFSGVHILKHPGCNVAYWNLHERLISQQGNGWIVNDTYPLVFYHFSGISPSGDMISRYTNHHTLRNRPELISLFENYRARLRANGADTQGYVTYAFGTFSNGELISPLLRAVYAGFLERFHCSDPFDANGAIYKWAKNAGLLTHRATALPRQVKADNWRDDRRIVAVNRLLRMLVRLVGVDRYLQLLKYLGYISILRNQRDVFERYHDM